MIVDILDKPTAKERMALEKFRTKGGNAVQEYCQHLTREDCKRARGSSGKVNRISGLV